MRAAIRLFTLVILFTALTLTAAPITEAQRAEYRGRRERVIAALESGSVLLLRAAATTARSGDVNFPFHQDENFYYLTGCDVPGLLLVLTPAGYEVGGQLCRELLFAPAAGANAFFGDRPGPEALAAELGLAAVLPIDQFQDHFARLMAGKQRLLITPLQPAFVNDPAGGKGFFLDKESKKLLKEKFPGVQIKPAGSLLTTLRLVKSPAEIALLQRAIAITDTAHREAFKSCAPGLFEYELQAVIEYTFQRQGCSGPGFPSIVGSGPNSLVLHYEENSRRMEPGEVVVMDIGAEYEGYCGDVTRTIPVSGKFTPEQRLIYNLVLQAHDEAIAMIKPGVAIRDLDKKAAAVIEAGLRRARLMQEGDKVTKFLPHGISHSIGLQVHDVETGEPLQEGMVITIEPGIYIRGAEGIDPRYWNIGIRIEDDVLVTADGHQVLSGAPRTIEEIEKLMQKKGIGNQPIG